jgi:hypothetical protein
MSKLIVVLAITIVILGIVSGFLFFQLNAVQDLNSELQIRNDELENQITGLENQISELQNQISEQETQLGKYTNVVKITEVTIEPGFNPFIGVMCQNSANVTIENLGVNNVGGLSLTIEHSSWEEAAETYYVGILHSGEKREVRGNVFSACGYSGQVTVTLKLGNITIDEYIVP